METSRLSTLQKLPPELFVVIFNHLLPIYDPYSERAPMWQRRASTEFYVLLPLSKTSKLLRQLTEPFIYRGIGLLQDTLKANSIAAKLVKMLDSKPHLQDYIKSLTVGSMSQVDIDVLLRCLQLQRLCAETPYQALLAPRQLTDLTINNVECASAVALALEQQPLLRYLAVSQVGESLLGQFDDRLKLALRNAQHLQEVRWGVDFDLRMSLHSYMAVIGSSPNLNALYLTPGNRRATLNDISEEVDDSCCHFESLYIGRATLLPSSRRSENMPRASFKSLKLKKFTKLRHVHIDLLGRWGTDSYCCNNDFQDTFLQLPPSLSTLTLAGRRRIGDPLCGQPSRNEWNNALNAILQSASLPQSNLHLYKVSVAIDAKYWKVKSMHKLFQSLDIIITRRHPTTGASQIEESITLYWECCRYPR